MPQVPSFKKIKKKLILIPSEGADLAHEYDANNEKIRELKFGKDVQSARKRATL